MPSAVPCLDCGNQYEVWLMPTENVATPAPPSTPKHSSGRYSRAIAASLWRRITKRPRTPAKESPRSTRKGLRPPVVSTQAEKGMRSRDPDRFGMETRSPAAAGVKLAAVARNFAVGPKSDTPAKPMKKPRVAPQRPIVGVPRMR